MLEKFLYPNHPLRCIITCPSKCGKNVFLTNLISNINKEYDKIYICLPSLHQQLYQNLFIYFSNYKPIRIITNILNVEYIDVVIGEMVKNKDFEKSDFEIGTYESVEELNFSQEYEDGGIVILDDLNERELNDPRVQAIFKRSRHNYIDIHNQPKLLRITKENDKS